jgi:transposase-like protein
MNCPHCASQKAKELNKKTALGYRTFRCSDCHHIFNERTGTLFNFLEYPPISCSSSSYGGCATN